MPTKIEIRSYFLPPKVFITISGVLFGTLLALSLHPYLTLVKTLGFRISALKTGKVQVDMFTDYVTALVWAVFLGICLMFSTIRARDKYMLLWAWSIKCFLALFVVLFYESHYPMDAVGYFRTGAEYAARDWGLIDAITSPISQSVQLGVLIGKYNSIVPDFIKFSFHSLKISFCMASLMGAYLFYRASVLITKRENRTIFWLFVLFPSLALYTSILSKECVVILFISIYTIGLVSWHFKRKVVYLFVSLLGLLLACYIRTWMGLILLVPLLFYFWALSERLLFKVASLFLVSILISQTHNLILLKMSYTGFDSAYKGLETVSNLLDRGGSAIDRPPIKISGPLDIIKLAPAGMFTALFRPLPGDVSGPGGALAGMEGLFLLYLFFKAVKRTRLQELNDPIVIWAIVLVISWALLYGILIQNFGTGLRWRIQILPIFLSLLLYLGRHRHKKF